MVIPKGRQIWQITAILLLLYLCVVSYVKFPGIFSLDGASATKGHAQIQYKAHWFHKYNQTTSNVEETSLKMGFTSANVFHTGKQNSSHADDTISPNEDNISLDEDNISSDKEPNEEKTLPYKEQIPHNEEDELQDDLNAYQENKDAHKNVFFLKPHKVGSSTLQNVFFRFVDNNNLNMGIPIGLSQGSNNFGYPHVFSEKYVCKSRQPINIIGHHMRYSQAVHNVMPAGTKFITIIRHPDTQFVSAFNYFGFKDCYSGINTIDDFAQNVVKAGQSAKHCKVFTRNSMLYDFGLEIDDITNTISINKKVEEISSNFDLVMLTEHFDESLVLLRDLLNWTIEDILYLNKIKNRKPKEKIAQQTKDLLRNWNAGDIHLYNYFNRTFWEKVDKYGRNKLNIEVEKLQAANKKWHDFCVKDMVPGTQIVDPDFKADYKDDTVMGYNLNDNAEDIRLCRQLATQEWAFSRKILRKMKELKYLR